MMNGVRDQTRNTIVINVTIIKGRDLLSADTNFHPGGKTAIRFNPYVELYFRDRKCGKTEECEKTLSPTWNERFKLAINADEITNTLIRPADFTSLSLRIFDKATLKNEGFIGESLVPLSFMDLIGKPPKLSWYAVGSGSGKLNCKDAKGEIQVKVAVSKLNARNIEDGNLYTLPSSCVEISLQWTVDEEEQGIDLDNSCMAVNRNGDVLMDESVYFRHLMNSNGSLNHSGDVRDGGRKETIFCNLDSVPLRVHALYFFLTVATDGKTLKDVKDAVIKVIDSNSKNSICQCSPKLAGDSTSMLIMRITRVSENWRVSLVDDIDKTAKKSGNLIPDLRTVTNEPKNNTYEKQSPEILNETDLEKNYHDLEAGKFSHYDSKIKTLHLQISNMEEKLDEMRSLVNCDSIDETLNQKESIYILENDVFNLMMLSKPCSITWFFSLVVAFFQMILIVIIVIKQCDGAIAIPFSVSPLVTIGQSFAILTSVVTQTDIFDSIKTFVVVCRQEDADWRKVFKVPEHIALRKRIIPRAVIPNLFKFCRGVLLLSLSFIIIINSDDVIDLFTKFAALQIISLIDNAFFVIGEQGYFGRTIQIKAKEAKDVHVRDTFPVICRNILPPQLIIAIVLLAGMSTGWVYIVIGQSKGTFFSTEYPNCDIKISEVARIGNGRCDGGSFNVIQCDFDGGDCVTFNLAYPNCKVDDPSLIGDGTCQEELNTESCGFDGGDCCPYDESDPLLGDGQCHGLWYNTEQCDYDGGDCEEFNNRYQHCFVDLLQISSDTSLVVLGDGICNGDIYNTEECGHESGDCNFKAKVFSPNPTTSDMSSKIPSSNPSQPPSSLPSAMPSTIPNDSPSNGPLLVPSAMPSFAPTDMLSLYPSQPPTTSPSLISYSNMPSVNPSQSPTTSPSMTPSYLPKSAVPSIVPNASPSNELPSSTPSDAPIIPFLQRDVLSELYESTNGDGWSRNDNWLSSTSECDWYGITCNNNGSVNRINMHGNDLAGTIPESIGDLSNLERLYLHGNDLVGTIPESIGDLSNLELLYLHGNDLVGTIPESISDLSNLEYLLLYRNDLVGTIPESIGDLSNLWYLDLSNNGLTGTIPSAVCSLNLGVFVYGGNNIDGDCT